MRFGRSAAMTLVLAIHLLLPIILIGSLWVRDYGSIASWLIQLAVSGSGIAAIFLMGSWAFASFYLRYVQVGLFVVAALLSFFRVRYLLFFAEKGFGQWVEGGLGLVLAMVFLYLIAGAIRSRYYPEIPIDLSLPFQNGVYAVFEGGNGKASPLMNYHYTASIHKGAGVNRSMKYAVDITRLGIWGNDAKGILPPENEEYGIFNEVVYSPFDGEVVDTVDQWPNNTPWSGEGPYNLGNHVLIRSEDVYVLMGHLQEGSLRVRAGDKVQKGQAIAKVGNSGWTTQPHLHIQSMKVSDGSFWSTEGLPILFDGKNAVKNALFFK